MPPILGALAIVGGVVLAGDERSAARSDRRRGDGGVTIGRPRCRLATAIAAPSAADPTRQNRTSLRSFPRCGRYHSASRDGAVT